MIYSQSFIKTLRENPRGAKSVNQALLERGSYIAQIGSGIFAYLPLGQRVFLKVQNLIRDHLGKIGVLEVSLPLLNPAELWQKSGRFQDIGEELIKISTNKTDEFVLAMTHEEVITTIAKEKIQTEQDLPIILGQISKKIRNETRPRGGLIRLKEFQMQDAYSFHKNAEELDQTYNSFIKIYQEIFKDLELKVILAAADPGMMGGSASREFMLINQAGEDKVFLCPKCHRAYKDEIVPEKKLCPDDKEPLLEERAIELAHIFKLGTKYSKSLDLNFQYSSGGKQPVLMGCYGLGLDRLIAAVVEAKHDDKGIIWPKAIAPFTAYLIDLEGSQGEKIYQKLSEKGIEILFDDRKVSAGVKFADADLLGIPYRLVLSAKTNASGKIELKERHQKESRQMGVDKISSLLNNEKKFNF